MKLSFEAPALTCVPVANSDSFFPVNRIYCVGRNYAEHAREMGGDTRDPPFFFSKPRDAIVTDGLFPYPTMTADVHHEIELVVALGAGGSIFGHAVGIDFTRRDLQAQAKKLGRPWDVAKGFDFSAPVSTIVPASKPLLQGKISLLVNGEARQSGDVADMIWSVAEIISELGRHFALKAGDLVFTGTPAGVGPVVRGDHLLGQIEGVGQLDVRVT